MESQELAQTFSEEQRLKLALTLAVPTGAQPAASPRLEDMAEAMGVSTGDLALLLNDEGFLKLVRGLTRAQANLTLHSKGVQRLVDIIGSKDDKAALTAIKLIGTLTGDFRNNITHEVKITYEDLRKRSAGETNDPLIGLFDIKKDIIDAAEVLEGDE
jgi:hypothetical protein